MHALSDVGSISDRMICVHDEKPRLCTVFGVSRDNAGFPCFLIHEESGNPDHRGQWRFMSAKYFVPATAANLRKFFEGGNL